VSSLAATLQLDVRVQARSKLYLVGVIAAVFLGLVGRFVFGPTNAGRVLAALYLLGIGGTTYIFGASLVLLEKSQGTLEALRSSPLTSNAYITSKVITLTGFAIVESVIVYAVGFLGAPLNPVPMVLGVTCLGVFYVFIGMGQVASHDSVFSFLIPGAMIVGSLLQLPFFYVLDIGPSILWHLIPTQGPLLLMLAGSERLEVWQWTYALGLSIGALVPAAWWARRRFARFIRLQRG
jgi:fluoroquinolone transport system permease protein